MAETELVKDVEAGRELDALIAARVMGWAWYATVVNIGGFELKGDYFASPAVLKRWDKDGWVYSRIDGVPPASHGSIPHYSTEHAAAFRPATAT